MTTSPIRILVVDDHRIVREGLTLILQREPDMVVVGSSASGEAAIAAFETHRPDIVLMDLQLPGISGVEATRAMRRSGHPGRIVVLTMYEGDEDIFRALEAGAATYLLKDSISDDLIAIIRQVHAGRQPLPPDVKARLDIRSARPTVTPREAHVLQLVALGQRNKEIAVSLSIREDTVEAHLKNIFSKLEVHDRTAAVQVALRRGILHLDLHLDPGDGGRRT